MHSNSVYTPIPTILRGPGARTKTILGGTTHQTSPTLPVAAASDTRIKIAHSPKPLVDHPSGPSSQLAD